MADVITRFKLETTQYDSKLRDASKALADISKQAELAGNDFGKFTQKSVEAARALGTTANGATAAKEKVRELVNAYNTMSSAYNALTDQQKQSDFAKAMAGSLQQLQQRITDAKGELNAVPGVLDNLASKFTVNIDAVKLFNIGLSGAKAALDVAKDAFFASEGNIDEWGRTVEGARGAYNVFLDALNNGNWSNFFSNLEKAIQGGRDLYDALDRLGSIKSNNQAAIALVQAQIQQLRLLKQQGKDVDEQIKQATQRLAALQGQQVEAGKKAGVDTVRQSIGNYINTLGGGVSQSSIDAAIQGILQKGQAEFDKYRSNVAKFENWSGAQSTRNITISTSAGTSQTIGKEQYFDINKLTEEQRRQYILSKAITKKETEIQQGISLYAQAVNEQTAATREEFRGNRYALTGNKGGTATTQQERSTEKYEQAERDYQQSLQQAAIELKAGTISSAEAKKKELQAEETLWKSIGDAREIYDSPKLKEAQAQVEAKITDLGPQVTAAIEAQKVAEKSARELAAANEKLAKAREELAAARQSGDLKSIYAAEKKVSTAETVLQQLQDQTVRVNVEQGKVDLPEVPTDDETIKVNVEQGKVDLPEVPADDQTIRVNVEQGEVNLPNVPTDDETIKVNVEPGKVDLPKVPTEISIPLTIANLDAFTSQLKQDLSVADFGSIGYNQILGNLNDSVALGEFIKTAIAAGVDATQLEEVGQAIWAKILNKENIDPSVFAGLYDILGQATGKNYVFDEKKETAEVKEDKSFEEFTKGLNTVAGGLSSVTSGMKALGVEIPKEINDAINVINAVGQIIAGVQAVISLVQTPSQTANTIALNLNTGALAALAVAVNSNTFSKFIPFFSKGGLVGRAADGMLIPGTSYSGDRLRMPVAGGGFIGVNSGELILNTSSQKNLAADIMAAQQLVKMIDAEGSVLGSSQQIGLMEILSDQSGQPPRDVSPYVDGEVIWLGLGNYLKGAGIGRIVTTNN